MVCLDATTWVYLDASKMIVYLRNRCFLKTSHKYRSKLFFRFYDNTPEIKPPPERRYNREHVYRMVKSICVVYEKKNLDGTNRDRSTPPVEGVPFKKQSIFFQYLPYWLLLACCFSCVEMRCVLYELLSLVYVSQYLACMCLTFMYYSYY